MTFTDPDGMGLGWIEHKNSDGKQTITYDSEIHTKEDAEKKGYKGVEKVFEKGTAYSADGEEFFAFSPDGKYTVNNGDKMDIDDTSYTTKDGVHISENKGVVDAFGDYGPGGLQESADNLALAAVPVTASGIGAPVGVLMAEAAGYMGLIGAGLEILNDAFEGKPYVEKLIRKGTVEALSRKVGGSDSFGPTEQVINDNIFNLGDNTLDEICK